MADLVQRKKDPKACSGSVLERRQTEAVTGAESTHRARAVLIPEWVSGVTAPGPLQVPGRCQLTETAVLPRASPVLSLHQEDFSVWCKRAVRVLAQLPCREQVQTQPSRRQQLNDVIAAFLYSRMFLRLSSNLGTDTGFFFCV